MAIELIHEINESEANSGPYLNLKDDEGRSYGNALAPLRGHRGRVLVIDSQGRRTFASKPNATQVWGGISHWFRDNGVKPGDAVKIAYAPSERDAGLPVLHLALIADGKSLTASGRRGSRAAVRGRQKGSKRAIGRSYVPSDEQAAPEKREPFAAEMDPDVIDRGRLGHKRTQNLLAELVRGHHLEPLRPSGEPQFDVAWWDGDRIYVAEVKSLTKRNEEKQLRLGLGQVLRYRQLLRERSADAWAVLALEREPGDKGWHRLCQGLDVLLWWPGSALPSTTVSGTASRARLS